MSDDKASPVELNKDHRILVSVRVRPVPSTESHFTYSPRSIQENTRIGQRTFDFDAVFGPTAGQALVYERVGSPIVAKFLRGFNATIFAYGQTGSGKTHSMLGTANASRCDATISACGVMLGLSTLWSRTDQDQGIAPRAIHEIFDRVQNCADGSVILLRASFMEIYNEEIYDLLADDEAESGHRLKIIADDSVKGAVVGGLSECVLGTLDDALDLLRRGNERRHVHGTEMNTRSSRSHAVFRIVLERKTCANDDGVDTASDTSSVTLRGRGNSRDSTSGGIVISSYFNLVDLAGSERQEKTGGVGERLREGSAINKSLSSLAEVIMKLSTQANKGSASQPRRRASATTTSSSSSSSSSSGSKWAVARAMHRNKRGDKNSVDKGTKAQSLHIPYRNSVLTRILKQSLGGNASTAVLLNVWPTAQHRDETIGTMRFGEMCKRIKTRAVKNEVRDEKTLLRQYRLRIETLTTQLKEEEEKAAAAAAAAAAATTTTTVEGGSGGATEVGTETPAAAQATAMAELKDKVRFLQAMLLGTKTPTDLAETVAPNLASGGEAGTADATKVRIRRARSMSVRVTNDSVQGIRFGEMDAGGQRTVRRPSIRRPSVGRDVGETYSRAAASVSVEIMRKVLKEKEEHARQQVDRLTEEKAVLQSVTNALRAEMENMSKLHEARKEDLANVGTTLKGAEGRERVLQAQLVRCEQRCADAERASDRVRAVFEFTCARLQRRKAAATIGVWWRTQRVYNDGGSVQDCESVHVSLNEYSGTLEEASLRQKNEELNARSRALAAGEGRVLALEKRLHVDEARLLVREERAVVSQRAGEQACAELQQQRAKVDQLQHENSVLAEEVKVLRSNLENEKHSTTSVSQVAHRVLQASLCKEQSLSQRSAELDARDFELRRKANTHSARLAAVCEREAAAERDRRSIESAEAELERKVLASNARAEELERLFELVARREAAATEHELKWKNRLDALGRAMDVAHDNRRDGGGLETATSSETTIERADSADALLHVQKEAHVRKSRGLLSKVSSSAKKTPESTRGDRQATTNVHARTRREIAPSRTRSSVSSAPVGSASSNQSGSVGECFISLCLK